MDQALVNIVAKELDTRDKRYMFLRIMFPESISRINLEGASRPVAMSMAHYFKMQGNAAYDAFSNAVLTNLAKNG